MDSTWRRAARDAHARAADLDRQILARYPRAWADMERMRSHPPDRWPDWCLLPMAAAAAVTGPAFPPPPIAAVSALYAWRYSRSAYVVEPTLLGRLLGQVPDDVGIGAFAGLPEWCVYVAAANPEFPGAGLWAHLEHDVNTGRPELRLLLDPTGEGPLGDLLPVAVYLDRLSLTQALADYRATTAAAIDGLVGADVRGGAMDETVAAFADQIDGYVGLLAYLCRREADIVSADRPGVRPVRGRSPARGRSTWLVGRAKT